MDIDGLVRSDYVASGVDVNGDGKVGMAEIFYTMRSAAGFE